MWSLVVSLLFTTPVVVNDREFDKSLDELAARAASATTDGEIYGAQAELRQRLADGVRRLDTALAKAAQEAPTRRERRDHVALRSLLASLEGRGHLARSTHWLDLVGAEVDPLERFVFLSDCVSAGVESTVLYQCIGDWDRFDPVAARLRADELATDPAARRAIAERFDARTAKMRSAFVRALAEVFGRADVAAGLERARAAFAAWQDEVVAPIGPAWEAAGDLEEALLLERPAAHFEGCEAAFAPELERMLRALPRGPDRAVSTLAQSVTWGIVVDAAAACAFANGRFDRAAGLERYGSARLGGDRTASARGPRTLAALAGTSQPTSLMTADLAFPRRDLVATASQRFRGNLPRTHTFDGVIAALKPQGESVLVSWKRVSIPDESYSCSGSNRITGAYVAGGTIGLTRDVSCGFRANGTVDVTPAPLVIPRAAATSLAVGQLVTLVVPYRDGEVYDSDAGYVLQIDGRTIVAPKKPEVFTGAFVVRATDRTQRELDVLLGVPLAPVR